MEGTMMLPKRSGERCGNGRKTCPCSTCPALASYTELSQSSSEASSSQVSLGGKGSGGYIGGPSWCRLDTCRKAGQPGGAGGCPLGFIPAAITC